MQAKELSVLMISLDPGFYDPKASSGDVVARHKSYAKKINSLDVIVLGGWKKQTVRLDDKMTIHITGVTGKANLSNARKIGSEIIKQRKIDLLVTQDPHATGWIGLKLKKQYKIPLGIGFHGDFWGNAIWKKESTKNRIYNFIQKKVVARANGIRVVSAGIKQKLTAAGVPEQKVTIVNTPVNDSLFSALDEKQKVKLEELRYKYKNRKILIFVGRLVMAKNLLFTLEVIDKIRKKQKDILLIIVGEGLQTAEIKELVHQKKLDSHIKLLGSKEQPELVLYYRLANLLLLLSTNESFGKVIIEAGLTGTPCLASATTGAKHIMTDGKTGFLVPINDLEATVDVLGEMVDYPEQTAQLGKWAQELYTKSYSASEATQNIINFWLKLANNEAINDNKKD